MLTLASPWWLVALVTVPGIWWLHRFRETDRAQPVAALFLWPRQDVTRSPQHRSRRVDPLWKLRSLTAGLIALALSRPLWYGEAAPPLTVWIDDSASMFAVEDGRTRMEDALTALLAQIDRGGFEAITVNSLARPGTSLPLTPGVDPLAARLREWARSPRGEPVFPVPAMMAAGTVHWLVTDGASAGIADWADRAPIANTVLVGKGTENTGIRRLVFSRADGSGAPARLLVTIENAGREMAVRELHIDAGATPLRVIPLHIPAGSSTHEIIDLPQPPTAALSTRLTPADTLPSDDELELDASALQPVSVALSVGCSHFLRAALGAHPALRLDDDPDRAQLRVDCDAGPEHQRGPALRIPARVGGNAVRGPLLWTAAAGSLRDLSLDPGWLNPTAPALATGNSRVVLRDSERPLILLDVSRQVLDVGFDLDAPDLVHRPEYPLLVTGLVDRLLETFTAGGTIVSAIDPDPVSIAPGALPPARPWVPVRGDPRAHDLTVPLILLALASLLLDPRLWRRGQRRQEGRGAAP